MIEVGKVTYAYRRKKPVLKDVSLKVPNGKIYGIFGLAESGKSTLLSLMAGARELQEGVIRINGLDLQQEAIPAKRCLGYCPQEIFFYSDMTVYELLDFVAEANAVGEKLRYLQIHEWMEFFDLERLRNRTISDLTYFQLLRLKLTQAVIGDSEILLLDEPAEGLSDSNIQSMKKMIRALKKKGKTIFLATERADDVLELADEIALLREGSLSEFAPAEEWISGCTFVLSTDGERASVLEVLSEMEGLTSCQPLGRDSEGRQCFRICAETEAHGDAVLAALREKDWLATVELEPCDETLMALRAAVIYPEEESQNEMGEEENP